MTTQMADRIHQARLAAGLTLAALGSRVGVSHTAIQKYEKGLVTPSSSQLLRLAQACGVRTEYFFRSHQVTLVQPQFRKTAAFGKTAEAAVRIRVAEQLEKRIQLLDAFPEPPLPAFAVPNTLPRQVATLDEVEQCADTVRHAWQLGMAPIGDLTCMLETMGLLVIAVDESHPGFCGLATSGQTTDGRLFPVIAVSRRWPGDRQRFTLAHELAHLMLEGRTASHLDMERACDRFAGAFLAPGVAVRQRLGQTRHTLEWRELHALKHEFGLSMGGWLHRAQDCGVISDATYAAMHRILTARGWRTREPGTPLPEETSWLFDQLVYRALGEHYLSESQAAELLGQPQTSLSQLRNMHSTDHTNPPAPLPETLA